MQQQCTALTKKGTRCARNGNGKDCRCYQHQENVVAVAPPPPPAAAQTLRKSAAKKLETRLRRGPKPVEQDGPGTIYIYRLSSDGALPYWKIGMTKNTDGATKRLKEWQRQHGGGGKVIKHAVYPVKQAHKFIERVVHLYLDYCRMARYSIACDANKDTPLLFKSVWYATGKVIEDNQWAAIFADLGRHKRWTIAREKSVEWFCGPIADIEAVVRAVVERYGK